MSDNFVKLLQKWDAVKTSYAKACIKSDVTGVYTKDPKLLYSVQSALEEIIMLFFYYGKYKDKLNYTYSPVQEIRWGQYATGNSEKMGCKFLFGIDYDGFFLSLELTYANHIKSMNDEFWCLFSDLTKLGKLHWVEGGCCSSESYKSISKLLNKNNSNIMKFICSYIFQEIEQNNICMGSIDIKWESEIDWEALKKKGVEAFRLLYKLNYLLYKGECSSERRKN